MLQAFPRHKQTKKHKMKCKVNEGLLSVCHFLYFYIFQRTRYGLLLKKDPNKRNLRDCPGEKLRMVLDYVLRLLVYKMPVNHQMSVIFLH